MRRFDKNKNIHNANLIVEQRYLESKGLVKETFQNQMTVNGRDEPQHPLVQLALYDNDIEGVRELVANGLNGIKPSIIDSVMSKKGEYGDLETVKVLMDAGANGTSALGAAACTGNLEMVKYLISKGVDATADNNYAIRAAGGTNCPRGYADGNHSMVVALLKQNGAVLPSDDSNIQ
mgnify:CR=1 FL=1|tara:strand:+ start:8293 stop:8823 length:531 start_codon:yes stop_codon:yes gene_type:complete